MTSLRDHKLQDIRTLCIQSHYPRTVGKNARLGIHGTGPTSQVRVLFTDQGAVGWGLSRAGNLDPNPLIGRSIADLIDPRAGVIAPEAIALDFPLHDLAGVILGQPVYKMLGGHGSMQVPCYDGAIYMDDILPEENPRGIGAVLENCYHDYDLGYRAFKLKIGRGHKWMEAEAGLQRDVQITQEVRKHFPNCEILVDANDGYTCEQFLRYLEAVVDCKLYWIEEPFREERTGLARLREFLSRDSPSTLVGDGEGNYDIPFLLSLAREKLLDVLMMDIASLGFTPWRQWMPELVAADACASPHTWGDPLKTIYAAHVAAGLGNVVTVEGIPASSPDANWTQHRLDEGRLHLSAEPGFGIRLAQVGA